MGVQTSVGIWTPTPHNTCIIRWGNLLEEGGLIAWTATGEGSVDLLNNDQAFNILSDLHFYCHGRLNKEPLRKIH